MRRPTGFGTARADGRDRDRKPARTLKASTRSHPRQGGGRRVLPGVGALLVALLVFGNPVVSAGSDASWPWPVPVDPPQITSTFMDGRSGGYHTGLDIRTQGRTGLPVRTPVAGSVVRVRTSPSGYGKAVYLDAGGGRTLVFAHLLAFADPIQERVTARQAATGTYAQQIRLDPGEITFEAGEVVALAGDTGTGAPHLHLEVREGDVPVNPIDFFDVPDREAPVISGVEVVARDADARVGAGARSLEVAHGDTLVVHGAVGIRVGVIEATGLNGFRLVPRAAELELDDGRRYVMAQDAVSFARRWQRGLELDRGPSGARWLSLFRHPDNTIRAGAGGFDGFVTLGAGERRAAVVRVSDHAGQGAAVRVVLEGAREPGPGATGPRRIVASAEREALEGRVALDGADLFVIDAGTEAFAGGDLAIAPVSTDAPAGHDGRGAAFAVTAPGVAFRRGVEISVGVPGDPATYTLNARDDRGRWSPESGVSADPERADAIRTRIMDTGVYRVVCDVTPPAVGPWRVDGDVVRGDVTLRAREKVVHGITRPRWPALVLDVADAVAGIDPDDVRVFVDDRLHPARPELEDDHVWIEWDVDPGPGTYDVRVEVADRLGHAATARIGVALVE